MLRRPFPRLFLEIMMFKRLASIGLLSLLSTSAAHAANCSAYTYTLTNGTSADANQVMSNFNNILNCGNNNLAPIASPQFTGSVGIGIAASANSLDVNGRARFVSPASGSTGGLIIRDAAGDPDGNYIQFVSNSNAAQYGFIRGMKVGGLLFGGGNVGVGATNASYNFFVNGSAAGTTAWTNTSDARLKKNIEQVSGALGLVRQLRGVYFDWRPAAERSVGKNLTLPTNERQIGFIAQEVEKVVPEAVSKPKDASGTYGLKEENLIPVLVEAIKEQQAEIEQLRATVAALVPTTQH